MRRIRTPAWPSRGSTGDSVRTPPADGLDFYGGVVVGAETIGRRALSPEHLDSCWETLSLLEPDDYTAYVRRFVEEGRAAAGADWAYADIVTAVAAAAELLAPAVYLEIGVRRGRSLAIVGARAPGAAIVGIDLWEPGYAGMENPGPDLVRRELAKVGHTGSLELLQGDSHELLPRLLRSRPELELDLVTVDGDHSAAGAARDLQDVLPRLRIGGALVFDDVRHPAHPGLHDVWSRIVVAERRYSTWQFDDVGYGVAVAVRRW